MKIVRKVKRKLKKIYKKVNPKKTYVYKNVPLFTVREICLITKTKLPEEYREIQNIPIHKTYILDSLEFKSDIKKNVKHIVFKDNEYLDKIKFEMRGFKKIYKRQVHLFKNTNKDMVDLLIKFLYTYKVNGYWYHDFFDFELYNRTFEESEKFLNRGWVYKVYKAANNREFIYLLKDKEQFNKTFKKYVKRKFLNANTATQEEFSKFVKEFPKFFAKPIEGTGGGGACIIDSKNFNSTNELYEYCKDHNFIVEEIVKQHKDMAKFNRTTLNTIRVYSLRCADDKVRILIACARLGRKGKDVDNFHCGGMGAIVDPKTGKIISDAIDMYHRYSDIHPDSKVKFKDFQVPCFDKIIKAIEECGRLIPELRHIGWDIAITEKGEIELIEGNSMPNFDLTQAPDQIGRRHIYEKYIKELEELNEKDMKK